MATSATALVQAEGTVKMHNFGCSSSFEQVVHVLGDVGDIGAFCHGPVGRIGLSCGGLAAALVVPVDHQLRIGGEAFGAGKSHRVVPGPQAGLRLSERGDARFGAQTGPGERDQLPRALNGRSGGFEHESFEWFGHPQQVY